MMKNSTLDVLKQRRSCRSYLPKQITEEELLAVLEAGTYAPTAKGTQSPKMVVIQDEPTKAIIRKMNAEIMGVDSDTLYGAPTYVLVLADGDNKNGVQDASLVMGNLMNAAYSIGLGSCWINRAKEEMAMPEGQALLKKWGLTGNWVGVGICILGYPAKALKAPAPRKADYILRV